VIRALCALGIIAVKVNEKCIKGGLRSPRSIRHSTPRSDLEWARDLGRESRRRILNLRRSRYVLASHEGTRGLFESHVVPVALREMP